MEETIGTRLRELRKTVGLSQQEFSSKVGLSKAGYGNYEQGRSQPLNSILESICRVYGANKEWLLYGTGPMFIGRPIDEKLQEFCDEIINSAPTDFRRRLVTALSRLAPDDWSRLELMARGLISDPEPEASRNSDSALHAALQRQLDEEKGESSASPFTGSNTA